VNRHSINFVLTTSSRHRPDRIPQRNAATSAFVGKRSTLSFDEQTAIPFEYDLK